MWASETLGLNLFSLVVVCVLLFAGYLVFVSPVVCFLCFWASRIRGFMGLHHGLYRLYKASALKGVGLRLVRALGVEDAGLPEVAS